VQLFIKRLRKKVKVKIKYYAVGEYGELHDREHYHILVFGWSPPLEDLYYGFRKNGRIYYGSRTISALWPYGYNTVGTVTSSSCMYTAGYVRKKLYGKRGMRTYVSCLPPFALQSTGLGASYAFANRESIQKHLSVVEGNKNLGLPRFYQRVLGIDTQMLVVKRQMKDAEVRGNYIDLGVSDKEFVELAKQALVQDEKNLIAQERIKR
jgi:hypothetical protein